MALLVAIIEVIGLGIVEVDRLLHQAQAEDARVEADVLRSFSRNCCDVMDAGHRLLLSSATALPVDCWMMSASQSNSNERISEETVSECATIATSNNPNRWRLRQRKNSVND
jgi:hypothetical protein